VLTFKLSAAIGGPRVMPAQLRHFERRGDVTLVWHTLKAATNAADGYFRSKGAYGVVDICGDITGDAADQLLTLLASQLDVWRAEASAYLERSSCKHKPLLEAAKRAFRSRVAMEQQVCRSLDVRTALRHAISPALDLSSTYEGRINDVVGSCIDKINARVDQHRVRMADAINLAFDELLARAASSITARVQDFASEALAHDGKELLSKFNKQQKTELTRVLAFAFKETPKGPPDTINSDLSDLTPLAELPSRHGESPALALVAFRKNRSHGCNADCLEGSVYLARQDQSNGGAITLPQWKIGFSRDPEAAERIQSLFSTSCSAPFHVVGKARHRSGYCHYVIEQCLLAYLDDWRIRNNRDFFMPPERARADPNKFIELRMDRVFVAVLQCLDSGAQQQERRHG
jgi:hypothetical protein